MRLIFLALVGVLLTPFAVMGPSLAQDVEVIVTGQSEAEVVEHIDPMAPRDAVGLTIEEFQWIAWPVIVFADTPNDPRFIEQMQLLAARPEPLIERDVVIIFETDPAANSAIRTALRPRGFALVVLQKDGAVGFRRPAPRDVREITRSIDNFSLRQEEMRMEGQ